MTPPTTPLPQPLRGNEVGTFAEDSVIRRLPEIALRTAAENHLDQDRAAQVEALADEIGHGTLTRVNEPEAEDALAWASYVAPYLGMRWIDAPWFFVETYFYRRLLAATGYSQPGSRRWVDPFQQQKQMGLEGAFELAARLGDALDDAMTLLGASLWANRVDLSLWPAGEDAAGERTEAVLGSERRSRLLVDDSEVAAEILAIAGVNVHLVLDNAGAELVSDLALAANILSHQGRVTIHAKPHPTFVSDVTVPDLEQTIRRLAEETTSARDIAGVLARAGRTGHLEVDADPFWVSPCAFWECPPHLVDRLGAADLIIIKGDANYRRLLGDLHWHPTTAIDKIIRPPAALVALRTPKAEVVAGLTQSVIDSATATDPHWMVDGEWGMIQYAAPQLSVA